MTVHAVNPAEVVPAGPVVRAASAKSFAAVFVLVFVLVWLAALAVHFVGNPDGIYPSPRNPSRRELAWKTRQLARLIEQGKAPSALVLGSSRMMQVSPQQVNALTGEQTFNFAAPGASPVDMLAQLKFALAAGAEIKQVIAGVDDIALFGAYDQTHSVRALSAPGVFAELTWPRKVEVIARGILSIKPQLTVQAVRNLISPPRLQRRRVERNSFVLLGDGYTLYPRRTLGLQNGTFKLDQERDAGLEIYRDMGEGARLFPLAPARVSREQLKALNDLMWHCRQRGIALTVIVTPVHPEYERMSLNERDLKARERLISELRKMCKIMDARCFDFSVLSSFGGDPAQFWDHANPTPLNMRRMINVAFGRKPDEIIRGEIDDIERIRKPTHVNSANTP